MLYSFFRNRLKKELFIYFDYLLYFILVCLEKVTVICSTLSLLLTDSPNQSFSVSVTDSKYILKVLAILWFLETVLSFSINVILETLCECLFEKHGLQVFQNVLVAVLTSNLSKYYLLHSLFILSIKLRCFL